MATQAVDPRLRMSPAYIGWTPGTVNLLRTAPKVPAGPGAGATAAGGATAGVDWAAISGRG